MTSLYNLKRKEFILKTLLIAIFKHLFFVASLYEIGNHCVSAFN